MAGPAGTPRAAWRMRATVGPSSQAISQPCRYTPPRNQPSIQRTSTAPAPRSQEVHRALASAKASRLRLDISITTAQPRHRPRPRLRPSQPHGTHREADRPEPPAAAPAARTNRNQQPPARQEEASSEPTHQHHRHHQAAATQAKAKTRSADAVRCPASPGQLTGRERPRLRRRGRDPAPVRGPAVVAARRRIPRRSPSASRALRGPSDRPAAVLDPAVGGAGRSDTPPRVGGGRPPGRDPPGCAGRVACSTVAYPVASGAYCARRGGRAAVAVGQPAELLDQLGRLGDLEVEVEVEHSQVGGEHLGAVGAGVDPTRYTAGKRATWG